MTREDIEKLNAVEPYCFESDREEQWYNIGLKNGLEIADEYPKSPWTSVEDDLPCNHEELIDGNSTKTVLVIDHVGCVGLLKMKKKNNGIIGVEPWWQWEIRSVINYWMPIPKLPK